MDFIGFGRESTPSPPTARTVFFPVLTTADLCDGIVLDAEHGSLMGESAEDLQRGVDAGVLYLCREPNGACPIGQHRGGPFLHYCDGYGPDDY